MAQDLLNAMAADRRMPVTATSAGVRALRGRAIDPPAAAALEEMGALAGGHVARQVDREMLREADLVLAMTPDHAEVLRLLSPDDAKKVHVLPAYALGAPETEGVADPHGLPLPAYRACARRLTECVRGVLGRLAYGA